MVRIQSRLFRSGFRGIEATAFVAWCVEKLATARASAVTNSAWTSSAPVVSFDDERDPRTIREVVTFENNGLAFRRSSEWTIHVFDSIGGMSESVMGPVERYDALWVGPLRFEMYEEHDARGWARCLEVRSPSASACRATRDRFRDRVANPKRIPPWEVRRVLQEEVDAARAAQTSLPDRKDVRRSLAARERELRRAEARAILAAAEEANWSWPWTEHAPRPPPRPTPIAITPAPAFVASASAVAEDPALSWRQLPRDENGYGPGLAEFLTALRDSLASPFPDDTRVADPRWSDAAFALNHLERGTNIVAWEVPAAGVRITLHERAAGPYGMDPAPQDAGVWCQVRAFGLPGGVVLDASTDDAMHVGSYRLLGAKAAVDPLHERVLDSVRRLRAR